ncbi:MAG: polymer-forming cytoskeletal protein [Candidatus Omnitrophota bacterium]
MKKWKSEGKNQIEPKILDVNASMQGSLRFDDPVNLRISGKFEGTLDTKGALMVGQKANIKANITGENVSIAGQVTGNVKAANILILESTARLKGDIESPRISIAEGAVFNGRVKMSAESLEIKETGDEDWMTPGQLSKYLDVEINKINEWANGGKLPGTKEGSKWVFERAKIDKWIAEGKVKE